MRSRNSVNTAVFAIGVLMVVAAILLSGCSIAPDTVRTEYEHVSHPFAGWPFGPKNEEDWLDTANVVARWQRGRIYTELGLGYSLTDGGFYGPKLTGTARAGVELWSKREGLLR